MKSWRILKRALFGKESRQIYNLPEFCVFRWKPSWVLPILLFYVLRWKHCHSFYTTFTHFFHHKLSITFFNILKKNKKKTVVFSLILSPDVYTLCADHVFVSICFLTMHFYRNITGSIFFVKIVTELYIFKSFLACFSAMFIVLFEL